MKKILILQNRIPDYRKPVYNALAEFYEVTVLHSGRSALTNTDRFRELIVPQWRLGPFFIQSKVLSAVKEGTYDVVIAMFALQWINNLLCSFLERDCALIYWGNRFTDRRIANWLRVFFMKKADGILLYGTEDLDRIVSAGIPRSSIFVAPNTVHIDNCEDTSAFQKDSFLFVGRAQKRKKIDLLIHAFQNVADRLPSNVILNIVGAGPENARLKELVFSLKLSGRVVFHGELLSDDALKPLFQRAFAYVSPGAVGLGVLHSFAYGVPVVTARDDYHGPEFLNLRHGHNACLFDEISELEGLLVKLVNEPQFARFLGRNAFAHYQTERSLERMIGGFRLAIETCCTSTETVGPEEASAAQDRTEAKAFPRR